MRKQKNAANGAIEYSGIGLRSYKNRDGLFYVIEIIPGGPADRAGIVVGDRILEVDRKTLNDELIARNPFRGAVGSKVELKVSSVKLGERMCIARRENIAYKKEFLASRVIRSSLSEGKKIGYLCLKDFNSESTYSFLRSELSSQMADPGIDAVILDLRRNPGGREMELGLVAGLFSPGSLYYSVGKDGGRNDVVAMGEPIKNSGEIPLVVLVGRVTASAGELLAGFLRHSRQCVLIGERTTGLVNSTRRIDLPHGYRLQLTDAITFLPDGKDPGWQGVGIIPDIVVPLSTAEFFDQSAENDETLKVAIAECEKIWKGESDVKVHKKEL